MKILVLSICVSLASLNVLADENFEKLLLPIAEPGTTHGAFGTRWISDLYLFNASTSEVSLVTDVTPTGGCQVLCPFLVPPFRVRILPLYDSPLGGGPGRFLYVRRALANDLYFSLILEENSRPSDSGLGTEIPIIRESEVLTRETFFSLGHFDGRGVRSTVRIYDFDAAGDSEVDVTLYSDIDGSVLAARRFVLTTPTPSDLAPSPGPAVPGYEQFDLSQRSFPEIMGPRYVHIRIQPVTPGLRYWAFLSFTDNSTQRVTTVTPH